MGISQHAEQDVRANLPHDTTPEDLAEISAAIDGSTHVRERPPTPSFEFWKGFIGVLGVAAFFAGVVMVFFFAVLGATVLIAGACMFAWAFREIKIENAKQRRMHASW